MGKNKLTFLLILLTACIVGFNCHMQKQTIDLKIMSFNIRHGVGLDSILNLSRSAHIIKSQAPDLCGLQEVDNFCSRSGNIGQVLFLAESTLMEGTFGKFMDYQKGEYGMATLVTKPLMSTKILPLPDAKYEPRSAIVHEVELTKGCTIAFANVHLDWIEEAEGSINRMAQAKALVQYLDSLKRATIITGDFNCTPDSPTMQYFAEQGFVFVKKGSDNLSYQGEDQAEIDHLLYRDVDQVKFEKKSIRLLKERLASDHRPLIVELKVTF